MSRIEIHAIKDDTFLYIDNYLWMWDTPQERSEQEWIAGQAFGSVLVAGLGLGVINQFLMANPRVTSIFTVERESGLREKVEEHYGEDRCGGGICHVHDFFTYKPLNWDRKWDCVFGDIWEDITPRSLPDYIRFKEHAQTLLKPNGKILAWGSDFFEYLLENQSDDREERTA